MACKRNRGQGEEASSSLEEQGGEEGQGEEASSSMEEQGGEEGQGEEASRSLEGQGGEEGGDSQAGILGGQGRVEASSQSFLCLRCLILILCNI